MIQHWNVKYHVNSVYPFNADENNITLNFYLLDSDNNVLAQKSLTVKVYKNQPDDLSKIINFLNKSSVLKELNLGDKDKKYHHLSRAEAAVILYEFLKLKSSNFKLPYDIELYDNPFSDIDKNTNYYKAVITLANYNGSDDISVLTKKYGVFNPLENVTRFQFVKMIIEGLNIPKTNDFSYIQNYDDFSKLGTDAKIYYSTAVKEGIIKGDNNKLLPYDKLTIFQALTILDRVLNRDVNVNDNQFELPLFDNEKIGNPLGILPDVQDCDPTITPIKINKIEEQKEGNCTKLTVISTIDDKAKGKDYYVWNANFGYFKKISSNNKTVIFCPSTKEPSDNFIIKVIGTDGYMNFDEKIKELNKSDFEYLTNIGDTYPNELDFNISLSLNSKILKENELFNINMKGNLYKDGLKIGLEKVAVELRTNNKVYYINNVKWDNNSIYFIVPSIKELYGKNVKMRVIYGTNYKSNFKDFDVNYKPLYIISGQVSPDENGDYPKEVRINNNIVNIDNGEFTYIAPYKGEYSININKNYQTLNISLTDENPKVNVYISYLNNEDDNQSQICPQVITHAYNPQTGEEKDFATPCDVPKGWIKGTAPDSDGDGVNDIKDAFPNDPAASVDSDGDGYPDYWNPGYSEVNSTTGLKLDAYPNDPNKWQKENNYNFYVYKGWNLKALPTDNEVNITIFKDAKIVWKWDNINQKWKVWMPYISIEKHLSQHKIDIIKNIKPAEGFWILSNKNFKLDFSGEPYGIEKIKLQKGWNLVGVGQNISINDLENKNIKVVWQYINGKWRVWGPDLKENIYKKFKKINEINATQGFWIYLNSSLKKIITKEGESITIPYNIEGNNCKVDFRDGNENALNSCNGEVKHIYKKSGVYNVTFYSDDKKVADTIAIVENNSTYWDGYVTSLDNYVEDNEKVDDFYKNGELYISPSLSNKSYYWTNFKYVNAHANFNQIKGDNFSLEVKVKDSSEEGGISAYDTSIVVYTDNGKSIGVSLMGEDWALPWVHIWAGDDKKDNLNELILDLSYYRVIKFVVKNQEFKIYADGNLLYILPFTSKLGNIVGFKIRFKGSGKLDYFKVYDNNDNLIYDDEF